MRISVVALLLFFSCAQKTRVPKNVLPPDKMEKLLLGLMEADELIARKPSDSSINDSFSRTALYSAVFAQNKISKKEFQKSFTYYESHPNLLKIVLDSVQGTTTKKSSGRPKP